ncbi:EmrB/QacA subfamily drug resistance transporter [Streptosporangium becharense]|uniref:EmrB/QacA subfamily drug resistance transporter n=1 Tax=Streptosporangium becharense TaxID=1816182 RepID=A0A7W9IMS0_9ACTN|nr:MFS transporter [Streptosporangium becharense]MBB2910448.1 EmrB/QacA subfamily drug resistance transporter [Streptosporangium becharense]MBB5823191.1 EmrB/QacA subfamily drug resistance transporter [Streptosporangium becharense]
MAHDKNATSPGAQPGAPHRWRWAALFVILAAQVMDLLDALIATIASPVIQTDLGGSSSLIQWIGAGYTLALGVGLITGGRLGDIYGHRRMFQLGLAGFTLASLLCGLASSPEMLVAARVLQGLAGALVIPQGLSMIKQMFPPQELGAAFGAFGPVIALSSVGGPILAGWLIQADLFGTGWRMIFLINLPVGVLALAGAFRFLPRQTERTASNLDIPGMLLVSAALFMLIFPLVQGRELGWPLWTFASMIGSLAVFTAFWRYEIARQRAGRDPLVIPGLFRKRAFSGGLVSGLAFFTGTVGYSLVFSMYAQFGLGYSPLKTGMSFLAQAIGTVIGFGLVNAGLNARLGRKLIHLGAVIIMLGVAGVGLTAYLAGRGVTPWQLTPGLVLTGIGVGLLMAPFFDIILAGVEVHEIGSASGALTATQQIGGAFGIAALGTIFFGLTGGGWAPLSAFLVAISVTLVGLVATFFLAFLLPRSAREQQDWQGQGQTQPA